MTSAAASADTSADSATAPAPTDEDRLLVAGVADNLVRLMRTFARAKARMVAAAEHDVEWSAHIVLRHLQHDGPMRAGALAESLQADPSTVSRQVATLVRDGLLERQADPEDGRASLLVLTDGAHDLLREHNRVRLDYFARVLDGWRPDEIVDFADKLTRFTTAFEATDTDWQRPRLADRAAPSRSTA